MSSRLLTGTNIELRIHTTITRFDAAAERWCPAAAGFVVTVIVHTHDADTGTHRRGQLAYQLHLDTDRQVMPVPRQLITCLHYPVPRLNGRAEITITTTS